MAANNVPPTVTQCANVSIESAMDSCAPRKNCIDMRVAICLTCIYTVVV